ncbi:MAG: hypothetical protein Edafosvirus49_2, partial [Edafosvirus sp.]
PIYDKINSENTIKSIYENILLNPQSLFHENIDESVFPKEFVESVIENIKSRVVLTSVQIHGEISVKLINNGGIHTLKKIFDEKMEGVNFEIMAPPIYRIVVDNIRIADAIINLEKMALVIKENCDKYKALFTNYKTHKVVRESDIRLETLKGKRAD